VTERTSDGLPLVHSDLPIDWQPWDSIRWITHIDQSCDGCGHAGPTRIAKGIVPAATRRRPDRRLIRFWAFRCPGCQETRVYDRVPDSGDDPMPMIEYLRPVIAMTAEPLPHDRMEP
jgi:hypothetical protein